MDSRANTWIALLLCCHLSSSAQQQPSALITKVNNRPSLVLENQTTRLVADLSGGAIGEFKLKDQDLNPLAWGTPRQGDTNIRGFGHFLCLDRWGPPSDSEGAKGMPYHGEAASVPWKHLPAQAPAAGSGPIAIMQAHLPKAGLTVTRSIHLSATTPVFVVHEEVQNVNHLGRMYNSVQHPTIAPPFLDSTTIVDCNGRRGFAQGGSLPNPEEPSTYWPSALNANGENVNLRHLANDPNPNVVSYSIDSSHGWITACTPAKKLLIGYVWRTSDYPWVSLWRDVRDGKPAARGLEFGTTGLHQPFPVLAKKGRIWDRQLFEYIDAGESSKKAYAAFLLQIPPDFEGVESLKINASQIVIRERRTRSPREFTLDVSGLPSLQ